MDQKLTQTTDWSGGVLASCTTNTVSA